MNLKIEKSEKPKTRLEALSDGLFAIVFTILVLELILKDLHFESEEAFKEHLFSLWPKFLSYILSFVILASYWIGHVEQFYFTAQVNRPFIFTNLLFLLFISLIPVSTILISEFPAFALSVRIYGLNLFCCQLALYLNWQCLIAHQLHNQSLNIQVIKTYKNYIWIGLILDPVGIGLSYISVIAGLIVLAIVPLIYLFLFVKDKKPLGGIYLDKAR